jgi:hypothetical protein
MRKSQREEVKRRERKKRMKRKEGRKKIRPVKKKSKSQNGPVDQPIDPSPISVQIC